MAYVVMAYAVMPYAFYKHGLRGYGLYSYGLYSYGLYSSGLYSYDRCSYGLYNYGLYSYGLYSDDPERYLYLPPPMVLRGYSLKSVNVLYIVIVYVLMALQLWLICLPPPPIVPVSFLLAVCT